MVPFLYPQTKAFLHGDFQLSLSLSLSLSIYIDICISVHHPSQLLAGNLFSGAPADVTVIITQEVRRMLPQSKVHTPFSRLDTSSEALGSGRKNAEDKRFLFESPCNALTNSKKRSWAPSLTQNPQGCQKPFVK